MCFPGGADGKESNCQFRRHKSHRVWSPMGKFPGEGHWQPTPVFLPGESHGEEPGGQVHGVAKSQTQLKWLSTHVCIHVSPPSWNTFPSPYLVYPSRLSHQLWVPCIIHQTLFIYFTYANVYVSMLFLSAGHQSRQRHKESIVLLAG